MREYKTKSKEIIVTTTIDTPIGEMFAAASKKGIVMLCFFTPFNIEARVAVLKENLDMDIVSGECDYFDALRTQLEEYFNKQRTTFEIPMQLVGSDFQLSVWKEVLKVQYGNIINFEQLNSSLHIKPLKALENPIAQNMINILVPCHRVIKDQTNDCAYAGGSDKKEFLLNLERGNI